MKRTHTYLRAIRKRCLWCVGGHEDAWKMDDGTVEPAYRPYGDVKACSSTDCPLHGFRAGKKPPPGDSDHTPRQAITQYCYGCLGGLGDSVRIGAYTYSRQRPNRLVRLCQNEDCVLYPLRPDSPKESTSRTKGKVSGWGEFPPENRPRVLQRACEMSRAYFGPSGHRHVAPERTLGPWTPPQERADQRVVTAHRWAS